ncbi:hypothetical protein FLLO111716_11130 [Flavobacterium longum]|uniref:hypothetical protein n=1 Tax=Flavobacterium longum TaxID=1299340 RepID=UPI0039EA65EB
MEKPIQPEKVTTHEGRKALIDRYNINDQGHAKSSPDDFVETVSGFRHADEKQETNEPLHPDTSNQKPNV